jgi:hypothetical protein
MASWWPGRAAGIARSLRAAMRHSETTTRTTLAQAVIPMIAKSGMNPYSASSRQTFTGLGREPARRG